MVNNGKMIMNSAKTQTDADDFAKGSRRSSWGNPSLRGRGAGDRSLHLLGWGGKYKITGVAAQMEEVFCISSRDQFIDVLKGYAISWVVIGHAVMITYGSRSDPAYLRYLDCTIIQLFILLSGWSLHYGTSDWDLHWVIGRAKRIFVPFLMWLPVTYAVSFAAWSPAKDWYDFSGGLFGYIATAITHASNGLWFLWALFGLCLVFALLRPFQRYLGDIVFPGALFLLFALPDVDFVNVEVIKGNYYFFMVGYLAHKHKDRLIGYFTPPVAYAALAAFAVLGWYWNWDNVMPFGLPENRALFLVYQYFTATAGIVGTIFVVKLLKNTYLYRLLAWLGTISLEIYAVHITFITVGVGTGLMQFLAIIATNVAVTFPCIYIIKRSAILSQLLFGTKAAWRGFPTFGPAGEPYIRLRDDAVR